VLAELFHADELSEAIVLFHKFEHKTKNYNFYIVSFKNRDILQ